MTLFYLVGRVDVGLETQKSIRMRDCFVSSSFCISNIFLDEINDITIDTFVQFGCTCLNKFFLSLFYPYANIIVSLFRISVYGLTACFCISHFITSMNKICINKYNTAEYWYQ